MDRRTFMKLLGGLASMPIVGRLAKPLKSETVQEGIAAVSDKGMQLYEMVISKVMKEGKKVGESGRVDSYKHPDRPDITVDVNQTDGSAEIYFDTDKGSKGFAEIRRDPESGSDELIEAEEVYKFFGKDGEDYVKDVEEGISGGITNLEEFTRIKKNIGGPVQPYDPRASATDFARAIDQVGAGTNMQKAMAIQEYDQNIQRQNMINRLQKMNPAGTGNFLQGIKDFGDHARVSQAMKGKVTGPGLTPGEIIPEYAMQSGYDFQKKFTGLDPKISAGLAAAYQTLQEGSRALNPFGDTFLRFPTAMKTAQEQATKNIEGILAAESNNLTAEQQANRNKFLASQGQPTETMTAATPTPKEGYITLQEFEDYRRQKAYDPINSPGNVNRSKEEIEAGIKREVAEAAKDPDNYLRNYRGNFDSIIASRLKDGGSVDLTIITMPDISGSGVESLFKTR